MPRSATRPPSGRKSSDGAINGRLRDAHGEGVHVQDHGHQPREQDHLDAHIGTNQLAESCQVDGESGSRGLASIQGTSIYIL